MAAVVPVQRKDNSGLYQMVGQGIGTAVGGPIGGMAGGMLGQAGGGGANSVAPIPKAEISGGNTPIPQQTAEDSANTADAMIRKLQAMQAQQQQAAGGR